MKSLQNKIIEAKDVKKYYELGNLTVKALTGISLEIYKGEFIGLSGMSGSGKSTLLNILGLSEIPSAGTLNLIGKVINFKDEAQLVYTRRKDIGYVFQSFNLLPTLTAIENVILTSILNKISLKESTERGEYLLERVGLKERINHYPSELSGGEMQRVAVCRAVSHKPLLLLADEPTGNLDSVSGEKILNLFKELNENDGFTLIMATHSEVALKYCSRIVRMRDGANLDT